MTVTGNDTSSWSFGYRVVRFGFRFLAVVGFFLLPFNVLYRLYNHLTDLKLPSSPCGEEQHLKKRGRVQDQVKKWRKAGGKKTMCTARPKNHSLMVSTPNYRETLHAIDLNDLNHVISLDTEKMVVKVEGGVTMGQLMDYLIPLGWSIPIVPEIETLTVSGLIMGGGLQSSSHKYGLFHRTCRSYEIVISSGEALKCTKDENSDLFYGIPISYGTYGFLTAIEIEIIPATTYVKVEYFPAYTYDEGLALMENFSKDKSNYFVEPILFSRNQWVVMLGTMTNSAEPDKINRVSRWYKPWFYKHVEKFLANGKGHDYLPLRDYYFRHTRCLFWHSVRFVPYGNNPIFRYLFGWILPINLRFLKSIQPAGANDCMYVQDFLVHAQAIKDIIYESEQLSKFYPVWFCPVNVEGDFTLQTRHRVEEFKGWGNMIYDCGFYGIPSYRAFHAPTCTRKLELVTMQHKGFRGMYTDTHMTREEMVEMWNLKEYDLLRQKYDAVGAFPDLCTKINVKSRNEGL